MKCLIALLFIALVFNSSCSPEKTEPLPAKSSSHSNLAISQTEFDLLINYYIDSMCVNGEVNWSFFQNFEKKDWVTYFRAYKTIMLLDSSKWRKYDHFTENLTKTYLIVSPLFGGEILPGMMLYSKKYDFYPFGSPYTDSTKHIGSFSVSH